MDTEVYKDELKAIFDTVGVGGRRRGGEKRESVEEREGGEKVMILTGVCPLHSFVLTVTFCGLQLCQRPIV